MALAARPSLSKQVEEDEDDEENEEDEEDEEDEDFDEDSGAECIVR